MISPACTTVCALPPISEKEVLRYTGEKGASTETLSLLRKCVKECYGIFSNKVAYRILPIERTEDGLRIASLEICSQGLVKNLLNCEKVIVFGATAGFAIDRLIAKYARISPAKALMFHSIGAERVEALCDAFCKKMEDENKFALEPRFSPGYGDLPLELQKEILNLLNAGNTVGIGLNQSLLLSPSKSVTAFAGIKKTERKRKK